MVPSPAQQVRIELTARLAASRSHAAVALAAVIALALAGCDIPTFSIEPEPPFETYGPPVVLATSDSSGVVSELVSVPRIVRNGTAWRQALTPAAYRVARLSATELAYSGKYYDTFARGIYRCIGCGTALFSWSDKYDSQTGWPSFTRLVSDTNAVISWDVSWGLRRRAVSCARCGSHLGHVFNDGPPPSRRRYCINSESLAFSAAGD